MLFVRIWCLPTKERGRTSTVRSPSTIASHASTIPAAFSSPETNEDSGAENMPSGLTLHLPHFPSPPHPASMLTPAFLDASSIVVPVSTKEVLPSGANRTTRSLSVFTPSICDQLGVNRLRCY